MNLAELREQLFQCGLNLNHFFLPPDTCREGGLCLSRSREGLWVVSSSERGEYNYYRQFNSENQACRDFLRSALGDPTHYVGFHNKEFDYWRQKSKEMVSKLDEQ